MHELTVCVPQSYRQVLCAGECQRCVYAHHRLSDHFSISISPHTSFPSIWIQYTSTYGGYSRVVIILVKSITDICQHYSGPHCTLGDDIMAPFWVIVFLQVLGSYQCYEHLYVREREVTIYRGTMPFIYWLSCDCLNLCTKLLCELEITQYKMLLFCERVPQFWTSFYMSWKLSRMIEWYVVIKAYKSLGGYTELLYATTPTLFSYFCYSTIPTSCLCFQLIVIIIVWV